MRTYVIRAVLALAVGLAVSAPAAAQSVVRGTVVDAAGKPIEGATVSIQGVDSSTKAETKTNRSGEFLQVGLNSGRYAVTATHGQFRQTLAANVSRSRPAELKFQLTPTSGLTPEQAKAQAEMQALAQSAIEAMRAGRDDEAMQKFNEIILKVPTCGDCYYNLGVAHSKKQQYAEAEAAFQKAIEIEPDSAEAYTGLANVFNAQKKFEMAQQASAKAAELTSASGGGGSAEALFNQGVVQWNSGKYAEAKALFEQATQADPNMAMAHYQLGMANLNLGAIPEARKAFEQYLKIDPNGPKAAEVKVFVQQLPQ
jgi:tetratricopeptide (TPR) repeat protein